MSEKDGGPVFPQIQQEAFEGGGSSLSISGGLSLRDYFAGQALAGLAAGFSEEYREKLADGTYGGMVPARAAYTLADALIKARTQGE